MKTRVFEVYSTRLDKWLKAMAAIVIVDGLTLIIVILIAFISDHFSETGDVLTVVIPGFSIFINVLFLIQIASAMTLATLFLYNHLLTSRPKASSVANMSPLRGEAIAHEKEIIELLKTVSHPLPNKVKLNRAYTARFLTAMKELDLIDPNFEGIQLMVWVQDETGYNDGSSSAFDQALKAVKFDDPKVARLKDQLTQIVGA